MKSKKRGLLIIILASFAILADIALFILEKSGYIVLPPTPLIEKTTVAAKMTAFAKRTVHRLFIRPAADICPFTVRFSVMYLELFSS